MRNPNFLVGFLLVLASCQNDAPLGSSRNPLRLTIVPSDDSQAVAERGEELKNFMELRLTKLWNQDSRPFHLEVTVPLNYIAVVESLAAKRADIAVINTYGYFLLKEMRRAPIEAIIQVTRGQGEKTYRGQFIVRADSKIKSLQDLNGKKIAFGDPASASGFILPMTLLDSLQIRPSDTVFAMKHDAVVTMVYQGRVDAGATYYSEPEIHVIKGKKIVMPRDARAWVSTQFPDIFEKTRVIGLTDEIPNAPWVLRTDLFKKEPEKYAPFRSLFQELLIEYSKTEIGKAMFKNQYNITEVAKASDEDYKGTIELLRKSQTAIDAALKPK